MLVYACIFSLYVLLASVLYMLARCVTTRWIFHCCLLYYLLFWMWTRHYAWIHHECTDEFFSFSVMLSCVVLTVLLHSCNLQPMCCTLHMIAHDCTYCCHAMCCRSVCYYCYHFILLIAIRVAYWQPFDIHSYTATHNAWLHREFYCIVFSAALAFFVAAALISFNGFLLCCTSRYTVREDEFYLCCPFFLPHEREN
jgi:hypothetical protein